MDCQVRYFHKALYKANCRFSSILTGLVSFMNETASTLGSINTTTHEKKLLARQSRNFNLRDPVFCAVFEELAAKLRREIADESRSQASTSATAKTSESEAPLT